MAREDSKAEITKKIIEIEISSYQRQLDTILKRLNMSRADIGRFNLDANDPITKRIEKLGDLIKEKEAELKKVENEIEGQNRLEQEHIHEQEINKEELEQNNEKQNNEEQIIEEDKAEEEKTEEEKNEEQSNEEEQENSNQEEKEPEDSKENQIESDKKEQENKQEQNKDKEDKTNEEIKQDKEKETGEETKTFEQWEEYSGVRIIPDEVIREQYDKYLTREEFLTILNNEFAPKVVVESGKAEKFLKSPEEWACLRTNAEVLQDVIDKNGGKLPVDVNQESYILVSKSNDIVRDKDNDGEFDKEDVVAQDNKEELDEENQRTKNSIPRSIIERYQYIQAEREIKKESRRQLADDLIVGATIATVGVAAVTAATVEVGRAMERIARGEEIETDKVPEIADDEISFPKPPVVS